MQLQRYESAKKRAKYEKPAQAINPDLTTSSVVDIEVEEPIENPFEIIESNNVSEMNEAMEIDYLRREKNYLLTKISCKEQQVGCIKHLMTTFLNKASVKNFFHQLNFELSKVLSYNSYI